MTGIEALREKLEHFKRETSVFNRGGSVVPKPNYREIKARIDPEGQAKAASSTRGASTGPAQPDAVELQIVNTYQDLVFETAERVSETLSTYNERLLGLELSTLTENIKDNCRSAISDFRAQVHADIDTLAALANESADRAQELKDFRAQHRLTRSARYPDDTGKLKLLALVFLMFLVETVVSTAFLAKSHEAGFIGAYGEALGFASLNLLSAFLLGRHALRFINHRNLAFKAVTCLTTIGGIGLAVTLNLALAHYREVAGAGVLSGAGERAFAQLVADPAGLIDVKSWLLMGIGVFFWLIALAEGYAMDDPYPGYGLVDRRHQDSLVTLEECKRDSVDLLSARKNDAEAEIKNTREQLSNLHGQVVALFNLRNTLLAEWQSFVRQANSQREQMLAAYYQARPQANRRSERSKSSLELAVPTLAHEALPVSIDIINTQVQEGRTMLQSALDAFYAEFDNAVIRCADQCRSGNQAQHSVSEAIDSQAESAALNTGSASL